MKITIGIKATHRLLQAIFTLVDIATFLGYCYNCLYFK